MNSLLQDVRYAVRVLMRSPGFTVIAVVTLALGIGVNSLMFSLVDAVLFRPLPVVRPDRVLRIGTTFASGGSSGIAYPLLRDFREQSSAFDDIAAFSGGSIVNIATSDEQPDRVPAALVSGNYFSLLGARPELGRLIAQHDDVTPGGHPILVLSDAFWRRRFGADSKVIGTTVRMNTHPYTIVGVSAAGFHGVDLQDVPDVWIPVSMVLDVSPNVAQFKPLERRGFSWLDGIARLKDGAKLEQGTAQLNTIRTRVAQELQLNGEQNARITAVPLSAAAVSSEGRQNVRRTSWILMGVAALVLLIACAVTAGLLLVRGEQRRRELAVRFAIGATRGRVMRQLFTESLLLSGAGAVLGVLLAMWGASLFAAIAPATFPLPMQATSPVLAARVLSFSGALALVCAALFGGLPAWSASKASLVEAIRRQSPFRGGRARGLSLRDAFVVTQVALSAMLLVGAGLLLRTLGKASHVDLGFDIRNTLVLSFDASKVGYTEERGQQFFDDLLARARELPGVESASIGRHVPLSDPGMMTSLELTHYTAPNGTEPSVSFTSISPDYFRTIGLKMERGRDFNAQDKQGAQVVIVNRAFAEHFWPGADPLQQRVLNFGDKGSDVIGVVSNARLINVRDEAEPMLYVPMHAFYVPNTNLLLKTRGDVRGVQAAVSSIASQIDRNVPLYRSRTLEDQLALSLGQERMIAGLLTAFAALALLLAAVGLYGVISYTTQIRTHEFGVRLALGALPADLLRMVMGQGARLAIAGLAIGLVAAGAASRVLSSLLFGVSPTDALTFACIAGVLMIVALAASGLPARRAARVDPMRTLRCE